MHRPLWKQPEFWTTAAAVAVLTVGHYAGPAHDRFWHDLFRRLYYLPIVLAGFRYGLKGGLVTAAFTSLIFLPHVLMTLSALPNQASEAVFEIPLYLTVGAITGMLSDRQRRAEESLRRAERLKTLGEMAAGMAHEVKNPLAAIRSSAQILQARLAGKEGELASIMLGEADHLNRVVNDFLEYARPAPLRCEPVPISRVLDSCLDLLMPILGQKKIVVAKEYPQNETVLQADPNQVRQVFVNLLLNAAEALQENGGLALRVEQNSRSTRVLVKDNGPGIPTDKLKRACEPFFTTKPGGTGLGLAIARRIVTAHGGKLLLESEPGRGTTATVILPGA